MFYVIGPFTIMTICSVIISIKAYLSSRNLQLTRNQSRVSVSRNNQVFIILLTTNTLFFCLVSPLVVLNAFGNIQENTAFTTIAYILAYANHALNFIFYGISCKSYRIEFIRIFKFDLKYTAVFKGSINRGTSRSMKILVSRKNRTINNNKNNNNIDIPLANTKSFTSSVNKR
jgi:hypothetical protein